MPNQHVSNTCHNKLNRCLIHPHTFYHSHSPSPLSTKKKNIAYMQGVKMRNENKKVYFKAVKKAKVSKKKKKNTKFF